MNYSGSDFPELQDIYGWTDEEFFIMAMEFKTYLS